VLIITTISAIINPHFLKVRSPDAAIIAARNNNLSLLLSLYIKPTPPKMKRSNE
jgi:hypothetical protein